jgi:hypothetical protein
MSQRAGFTMLSWVSLFACGCRLRKNRSRGHRAECRLPRLRAAIFRHGEGISATAFQWPGCRFDLVASI